MKRVVLVFLFVLSVGMLPAFADGSKEAGNAVKEAFKNEFPGVTLVKWSNLGDFQMATFVLNGSLVNAYFNTEGGLEGYARVVLFDQLPMAVTRAMEKRFPEGDFSEIMEVSNPEGTSYWLTVEMYNKSYRISCTANGDIVKKIKNKR